jgi:hypothetical protein
LHVNLIGDIYLSEVLLGALVVHRLLGTGLCRLSAQEVVFVRLLSLWGVGQLVSDIYSLTPAADIARGLALIAFTAINFFGFRELFNNGRVYIAEAYLGVSLAALLMYLFSPDDHALADNWKFGLSLPVTLSLLAFASVPSIQRRAFLSCAFIVTAGGLNLQHAFRSAAGMCFLVLALVAIQRIVRGGSRGMRRAVLISSSVLVSILAVAGYSSLAGSGSLGVEAQEKYETQSTGTFGVLLGGRQEPVYSLLAIKDRPLLGYGTDPPLSSDLDARARSALFELGYERDDNAEEARPTIPTHSGLFGAWVFAGILGVPVWLLILKRGIVALVASASSAVSFSPLLAYVTISAIWDVLYSPFGAGRRMAVALMVVAWTSASAARGNCSEVESGIEELALGSSQSGSGRGRRGRTCAATRPR